MESRMYAIVNCAFNKMKPQDKYIDGFIPWQELWRNCPKNWDLIIPFNTGLQDVPAYFTIAYHSQYGDMRFRVCGFFKYVNTFNKFHIQKIIIITWDDSEKVLAEF